MRETKKESANIIISILTLIILSVFVMLLSVINTSAAETKTVSEVGNYWQIGDSMTVPANTYICGTTETDPSDDPQTSIAVHSCDVTIPVSLFSTRTYNGYYFQMIGGAGLSEENSLIYVPVESSDNAIWGIYISDGAGTYASPYRFSAIYPYDITFNANGGEGTMSVQTIGGYSISDQFISANTFTRTGYTFTGWNTEADGTGISYDDEENIIIESDTTLYAQWAENATITWKNYDGTTLETDDDVSIGSTPTYNGQTPKRPKDAQYSYTFSGWSPSVTAVTGDAIYTATYTSAVNSCTVTFDANGHGDAPSSQSVKYNQTATKPSDPSATGYAFGGWFTDSACTDSYDFGSSVTKDITLYAKWTLSAAPVGTKLTNTSDKRGVYTVIGVSDSGASVKYTSPKKKAKKVSIPSKVKDENGNTYKVTSIGKGALRGNKNITKLIIPKTVTTIEANAFSNCSNLKSITIYRDRRDLSVGNNAFKGVTNAKITIYSEKKQHKKIVKRIIKTGAKNCKFERKVR